MAQSLSYLTAWGGLFCICGLLRFVLTAPDDIERSFAAAVDEQAVQLVGTQLIYIGCIADAIAGGTLLGWGLSLLTIGMVMSLSWTGLQRFFDYRRKYEELWELRNRSEGRHL